MSENEAEWKSDTKQTLFFFKKKKETSPKFFQMLK